MDLTVAKFSSHEEAEKANREYYRSLTPQQRIRILLDLIACHGPAMIPLEKDLRDFIELLNSHGVEYVVLGGLAFHGHPRFTGDVDILDRNSKENAERVHAAVQEFGFATAGLSPADFTNSDRIIQLGRPPGRIDILTKACGVEFDEVWRTRVRGDLDGAAAYFISRECLIKNKKAADRPQDRADLDAIGG
jgi:hypothetical protein